MASEEPPATPSSSSPVPPSPLASVVEWGGQILKFELFQSLVDEGFWRRLASLKLDTLGIDESPIEISGFYAPCSHPKVSNRLMLLAESFPPDSMEQASTPQLSQGNRNKCPVPGIIYNTNTRENFLALDRKSLLRKEGKKILDDILSGKVEEYSAALSRFLIISFADLKTWSFSYWLAFPALALDPPASILNIRTAKEVLTLEEAKSLTEACNAWRNSSLTTGIPFFLVTITSDSQATIRHLKDWQQCQDDGQKLLFGFYDPSHLPSTPGWPLRNYLAFISLRYKVEKIQFLCYREKQGLADLGLSLVGEALVLPPKAWADTQFIPETVGWEPRRRNISLAENMDPKRLAVSAADLNLKLMRWRTFPSLDLNMLKNLKCLLLGAGTLGCDVARLLMAWGVRKITLVDNGRVSMSNLVRQSLYVFEDSLNGGEFKAVAAARSLKRIFPDMEAEGIVLSIAMPGHPMPPNEVARVLEDCSHLQTLIASHDVTFLLTDTRESRWLPTLFCANENKIAITAALGFDSFLVMRHGAGPHAFNTDHGNEAGGIDALVGRMESLSAGDGDRGQRLGCYFCNDVVAPIDSTTNRTLDQQCTVTRPGAAYLASALAVELLVGLLHHPKRMHAPGELANSIMSSSEQPLGILPHQVRGLIPQFMQMALIGFSSNSCTACSDIVVSEYRKRGMEFVLQAIDHPTYLEDLTGITDLIKSTNSIVMEWDNEINTDDDFDS